MSRDEVYLPDGTVKPHWQDLLSTIERVGAEDFEQKEAKSRRILRDDGATYNIYDDLNNAASAWSLDLVPFVISSEEWGEIESGLLERAELFNLLLKDLYGPRKLISQGVIPPEALFSHPGFLRSCDGITIPDEHQLILHAVDMARNSDGNMCVMTDRTQAPSGAGYALENRTVMSRVFPSLYRESQVHRLASFFQRLRAKLYAISPNQKQPRVVVLTPGPHNETYFEHAFIANYLGFLLVQSGDLVVRNGFLWMKSLQGLSRVDVVLRRVDDWYCDPVELRGDSLLGVAGLLEAVRAGNVVLANPLGSGILESPIFLRYLPDISKHLLGRDMRMQTVETYWCGNAQDMAFIEAHFDELVIKPAYRGTGQRSVHVAGLTEEKKKEFLIAIKANPYAYVAQPILDVSFLPTYDNNVITSRPAVLRSFVTASEKAYSVMPGGLTRVGIEESAFYISNQAGSKSKDTWVISSEPSVAETQVSRVEAKKDAEVIRLPSRVVENLFWMGRYAERAEASLRLLRTVFMMLNGEEPLSRDVKRVLLTAVTKVTTTYPGFTEADDALIDDPYTELLHVVVDAARPGSIAANLNAMLYCADESKELVSSDTLRVINDIRDILFDLQGSFGQGIMTAPEESLDPLVTALMALSGLGHESMGRGVGWRFMQIGRRLERSIQTNMVINDMLAQSAPERDEKLFLYGTLLCLENLINYRRRYSADLNIESCLDLIMLDSTNPRSLLFQLNELYQHLTELSTEGVSNELDEHQSVALQAQTLVKLIRLKELCQLTDSARPVLAEKLVQLNTLLSSMSDLISDKYFDHRESSQQLVLSMWEN
ncbi:circularly permuted type 2 ATP-grasp protein [Aurantivibrio plasticivorans]